METTYIHEINTLHASNGELYIGYGDDNNHIVFNTDTLFKDLPSIIEMVCKENKNVNIDSETVTFDQDGTEVIRVNSNGNVGIIADSIINILHHYTNINNDDNTEQMLWDIIDHCKTLRGD